MWCYVFTHVILIVLGFFIGCGTWLTFAEYAPSNIEKVYWIVGGIVGAGIGWFAATQLMNVARDFYKTLPPR